MPVKGEQRKPQDRPLKRNEDGSLRPLNARELAAVQASLRRTAREKDLRKSIKGHELLANIAAIDSVLAAKWTTLNKEQVAALRLRADLQFRRLAKILPDLKSVELVPGVNSGERAIAAMPTELLEQLAMHGAALAAMFQQGVPIEGEAQRVEPAVDDEDEDEDDG